MYTVRVQYSSACAEQPVRVVRALEDARLTALPSSASFECELSRAVSAKWLRDGRALVANDRDKRFELTQSGCTHRLRINDVSAEDAGLYTLEARGATSSAHLLVEGALFCCNRPCVAFAQLCSGSATFAADEGTLRGVKHLDNE